MGFWEHLVGNGQRLVDEVDDTSPTRRVGGRTWIGPVWVGDAAGTRLQVLAALLTFQPYPWATATCGVVSVQRDRRS